MFGFAPGSACPKLRCTRNSGITSPSRSSTKTITATPSSVGLVTSSFGGWVDKVISDRMVGRRRYRRFPGHTEFSLGPDPAVAVRGVAAVAAEFLRAMGSADGVDQLSEGNGLRDGCEVIALDDDGSDEIEREHLENTASSTHRFADLLWLVANLA